MTTADLTLLYLKLFNIWWKMKEDFWSFIDFKLSQCCTSDRNHVVGKNYRNKKLIKKSSDARNFFNLLLNNCFFTTNPVEFKKENTIFPIYHDGHKFCSVCLMQTKKGCKWVKNRWMWCHFTKKKGFIMNFDVGKWQCLREKKNM